MNQQTPDQSLKPFPYVRSSNGEPVSSTYLVYKARKDFVRIQANTAGEAIKKSAILSPWKVERYDPLSQVLLSTDDLGLGDDMQADAVPDAAHSMAEQTNIAAAEPDAPAQPSADASAPTEAVATETAPPAVDAAADQPKADEA